MDLVVRTVLPRRLSAETAASDAPESAVVEAPAAPAAPAATLKSVQQVKEYRFNPDRYQDFDAGNSGWLAVEAVRPIKVQRLWATMEASSASETLGHFIFDNVRETFEEGCSTKSRSKKSSCGAGQGELLRPWYN